MLHRLIRRSRQPPRRDPGDIRFRLGLSLALVAAVLVFGTVGYLALGLEPLDALFKTIETVSTVGFGEISLDTPGEKVFTIILILVGVGTVLYSFTVVLETIIEGRLTDHLWRRRMEREIAQLNRHVIVCGCGRLGRTVADYIADAGRDVVVVDLDLERLESTAHRFVHGDANLDDTLRAAGIERAATLVAALSTDADNVYLTLAARALRPDIFVIARARVSQAEARLRQAGANRTINPQFLGGARVGAMALQPHVAEFVDVVMHDRNIEFRLEELIVADGSPLGDCSIREAQIRDRTGALVLAVREADGHFITNPTPDTRLEPGHVLIAIGTEEQLRALAEAARPPGTGPGPRRSARPFNR
ncbi:MAG: potassium channel protein [Acidimicrobiales bacterium]|nr:potassium channel protein [Acidimicrobiales bacterium]